MGIQKLQIRGYRSLNDVTWEPRRLNVLIGPNGAGKTNLLRALAVLQRSAQGELNPEVQRQGGLPTLLWDGQAPSLSLGVKTDPVGQGRDSVKEALTYELQLGRFGSSWRIERELLGNYYLKDLGQKTEPKKFLERRPGHAVTFDFREHGLTAHEGDLADDAPLLSRASQNPVIGAFREGVASWSLCHDIRTDMGAPLRQPTEARSEERLISDGQNLVPVLHTLYTSNRDFERAVDQALRAAFGQDYERLVFPPTQDKKVQLRMRWRSLRTEQPLAHLSEGTLRFLLLIALFASPSPGDLIAVDEPEAHLHPGMLSIIALLASMASQRTQVVLTTQSPRLLEAFPKEANPSVTVVECVEGQTRLTPLEGEELRRWLERFKSGTRPEGLGTGA